MRSFPPYWLIALLFLAGCSMLPDPGGGTSPLEDLTGITWKLDVISDADGDTVFVSAGQTDGFDEVYTIYFKEDGSFTGQNSCNDCEGEYETGPDSSISISMGCEETACGGNVYLAYNDLMVRATSYTMAKDELRIYATNRDGKERILHHHAE